MSACVQTGAPDSSSHDPDLGGHHGQERKPTQSQGVKCAAALAALALLVTAKLALETSGVLETGNMAAGAVMMASGIGLAILGGTASVDFTRSGNEIKGIQTRTGITKQDITDYERARRG